MNFLLYSDRLFSFEYGEAHPFKPSRAKAFFELLKRYGLIDEKEDRVFEPSLIDEEVLLLYHEREYIELLKRAESSYSIEMYKRGIGTEDNPVFKGMYEFSLLSTSGTFLCAEKIIEHGAKIAFNPVGGFHHAEKGRALGFCYINDVAVVGAYLLKKGFRIAIVDIDAHHGNGTQEAFYEEADALTISIHESGASLFPGTGSETEVGVGKGYGFNVNIPLLQGSDDEIYSFVFESIVPPLISAFRPDVLFAIIGCDAHKDDPLSHLNISASCYKKIIERLKGLSHRIIALGAGGYNFYKTSALWAIAWSIFCEKRIEDQYAGIIGGMMYGPELDLLAFMEETSITEGREKEKCKRKAEEVVRFIRRQVFPLYGLKS